MKLPITPNTASDEVKNVLGFLDANMKIKNIMPDIYTAAEELIDIIGIKTYTYIVDKYEQNPIVDYDNLNQNLVRALQSIIFSKAYIYYAPSNDLSHTNGGRKMRNEEHEKNAFEWMIEADNIAQEKRYYRSIDLLLKMLDNSKTESESDTTIYTIWTSSEAYKKTQSLFIRNTKQFSESIVIESQYLFHKLCPGISECEIEEILPRIGEVKFNELKQALKNNSIIPPSDETLLIKIRRALANYAIAYGIEKFSVSLLPDAVVQKFTSERQTLKGSLPTQKNEPQNVIQSYMNSFEKACIQIEKHLTPIPQNLDSINLYPEIKEIPNGFSA